MKPAWIALCAGWIVGMAAPAVGQPVLPSKSGTVAYIEGLVYLDGAAIPDPIVAKFPVIKEGGVLRTMNGRAEILMNPGYVLRVGENAEIRMAATEFVDTRVELARGSAVLQVPETAKDNNFTLLCKDAAITIEKAGDYRFDAEPGRLKVYAGKATVKLGEQIVDVSAGKMLDFGGGSASATKFDREASDALDRWSARRGELMAAANASAARDCADDFVSPRDPCQGNWRWNPWYGLITYIPYGNRLCDPWTGYCYYNRRGVMDAYYRPRVILMDSGISSGGPSYPTAMPTSSGSSGVAAASSAAQSAPSAGTGSSAGAAAAGSSVGRGSSAGGGHGR